MVFKIIKEGRKSTAESIEINHRWGGAIWKLKQN